MSLDFANPYARFTPRPGVSAEDFSFQNSFDSLLGQTESLSVAGLTGSIDTIGKYGYDDERNEKKDKDGISWDDVADAHARMQEEIRQISVAGFNFTDDEIDSILEASRDPNKLAQARDRLMTNGMSAEDADKYTHMAIMLAEIADKRRRGEPLTAEDRAFEQEVANMPPEEREKISTASDAIYESANSADINLTQDTATTTDEPHTASPVVDNEFDANELSLLQGGGVPQQAGAFEDITRIGPIISEDFNAPAIGFTNLAETNQSTADMEIRLSAPASSGATPA